VSESRGIGIFQFSVYSAVDTTIIVETVAEHYDFTSFVKIINISILEVKVYNLLLVELSI
jgi:hypothetical protein